MAEIDYSQVTGLVHSTESFGSVDGPGIRFIVSCKAVRCVANIVIIQILGLWSQIRLLNVRLKMS